MACGHHVRIQKGPYLSITAAHDVRSSRFRYALDSVDDLLRYPFQLIVRIISAV